MLPKALLVSTFLMVVPLAAWTAPKTTQQESETLMSQDDPRTAEVRQAIDDLIQTATTYDVETLDRIYHDDLHVVMIDTGHNLNTADKAAFKGLFASKRDAGDPPMNTWAKFHSIEVTGDKAHVLLSRKNDLSGVNMDLTLSIDLTFEDNRWQVLREVIFLRPEDS